MKIIIDNQGDAVGRGDGSIPLAGGFSWVAPTPELEAQLAANAAGTTYPIVRVLSKLTILRRLEAAGLDSAFFAALESAPTAIRQWNAAQELRTDDPMLVAMLPAIQAATGATDAQIAEIIQP